MVYEREKKEKRISQTAKGGISGLFKTYLERRSHETPDESRVQEGFSGRLDS